MSALKSSQLRTSVSVPDTGQADRQPSDRQDGFYARPSAYLPWLVTRDGIGAISRSSGIVRFVWGGVVKTFRCTTYRDDTRQLNRVTSVR
ncbi:MAG: hypothetical protein ABJM81_27065 [Rhodopirellula bahusiensis]|uniref:hypothetical protein n=1 Tax=Rhodopirellula bahusiensis TaxID=2014065 RepID=UPI003297141F